MKKENKKGFSLVELLAVIAIIGIISTIVFVAVNSTINTSKNKISEESEKMIIESAKYYSIEYRNSPEWFEGEKEGEKEYFCISLNSLINSGYYKGDENSLDELKDDYFVYVEVDEFEVYNYKLISIDEAIKDGICMANYYVSNLTNQKGSIEIKFESSDSEFGTVNIGGLNYEIVENEDGSYKLNTTFKNNKLPERTETEFKDKVIEFSETITKEVEGEEEKAYITLVLDKSGSMESHVNELNTAAVNIIDKFIDDFDKTEISLIEFDDSLLKNTDFSSTKKYKTTELSSVGSGTNISYGLVKALEKLKNKDGHKFIILFYDGQPTDTIYYTQSNKKYYPSYYDTESKSYKRHDTFFNNYTGKNLSIETCKDLTGKTTVDFNTARCFYDLQKTTSYIKGKTDIKLITVLLPFYKWEEFGESIQKEYKQLSTIDNELCNNSDYLNKTANQYNCYYESNTASKINQKFNVIFDRLKTKIKPKKTVTETKTWTETETIEEIKTITFDDISEIKIKINFSEECYVKFSEYENIESEKFYDEDNNLKSIIYTMNLGNPNEIENNLNFTLSPTCNINNSETTDIDNKTINIDKEIELFNFEIIYYKGEQVVKQDTKDGTNFIFKYSQFEAIN